LNTLVNIQSKFNCISISTPVEDLKHANVSLSKFTNSRSSILVNNNNDQDVDSDTNRDIGDIDNDVDTNNYTKKLGNLYTNTLSAISRKIEFVQGVAELSNSLNLSLVITNENEANKVQINQDVYVLQIEKMKLLSSHFATKLGMNYICIICI
jgi:hypothetical protein